MDNSAGWSSYSLVNAYIWIWFGLVLGMGLFANPWTAVMYTVWAMSLNIIGRKVISTVNHRRNEVTGIDDAGALNSDDALVEDFGALAGDAVVMTNDDKVKLN